MIILAVIAVIVVMVAARQSAARGAPVIQGERFFRYVMSGAGLLASLWGISGLLALGLISITRTEGKGLSGTDVRSQASHLLAALVVGAILAGGSYLMSRGSSAEVERTSTERRWWIALLFGSTGVMALVAGHGLLRSLALLMTGPHADSLGRDTVAALAGLLVWGAAWSWSVRAGRQIGLGLHADRVWDGAFFLVAAWSLAYIGLGLLNVLQATASALTGSGASLLPGAAVSWGPLALGAAGIVAGGIPWAAAMSYDVSRGGRRVMRIVYLYVGSAVGVTLALGESVNLLYELLRRLFGYSGADLVRSVLPDILPVGITSALVWAMCWSFMRFWSSPVESHADIPWPRLPAVLALTLAGLLITIPATIALLWLPLDWATRAPASLTGSDWWRDQAASAVAGLTVGVPLWIPQWRRLVRAVRADSHTASVRRTTVRLAGLVVLGSALAAAGFTVALFWLLFQQLLGAGSDPARGSWMVKDVVTVLVLAGVGVYHARFYLRTRMLLPRARRQLTVSALVGPGADDSLTSVRELSGVRIDVTGRLLPAAPAGLLSVQEVAHALRTAGEGDDATGAFLLLWDGGGVVYPYGAHLPATAIAQPTM